MTMHKARHKGTHKHFTNTNMNHKNSKNIRAEHPSQSDEQSGTAIRYKKYKVTLGLTQKSVATVYIEATSFFEAWKGSHEYQDCDVDFCPVANKVKVLCITRVKEAQTHE